MSFAFSLTLKLKTAIAAIRLRLLVQFIGQAVGEALAPAPGLGKAAV
jgi:hypothetical protein